MKQKVRILGGMGILAYIVLSFIDRIITKISDIIYIPTGLFIIAFLLFSNTLKKYIRKK